MRNFDQVMNCKNFLLLVSATVVLVACISLPNRVGQSIACVQQKWPFFRMKKYVVLGVFQEQCTPKRSSLVPSGDLSAHIWKFALSPCLWLEMSSRCYIVLMTTDYDGYLVSKFEVMSCFNHGRLFWLDIRFSLFCCSTCDAAAFTDPKKFPRDTELFVWLRKIILFCNGFSGKKEIKRLTKVRHFSFTSIHLGNGGRSSECIR